MRLLPVQAKFSKLELRLGLSHLMLEDCPVSREIAKSLQMRMAPLSNTSISEFQDIWNTEHSKMQMRI